MLLEIEWLILGISLRFQFIDTIFFFFFYCFILANFFVYFILQFYEIKTGFQFIFLTENNINNF